MSQQPFIVVVSGGGPVGLTFSLNLAMMMGKHVKIIIYEIRWTVNEGGVVCWQEETEGKGRLDHVITLQDYVIEQLPMYIQKGLFQNINERVWPMSRNIPIREVEDRLLALIQPFVNCGQIELIPEQLHEQTERIVKGDFDLLVGADGSNSFVRRYCNIQMINEGVEYACGLAFNIPSQVATPLDEPLHQALNCILSVSQTRYLLNSNDSRRGYLYIRLIENEYEELREHMRKMTNDNRSLDLSDNKQCPTTPLWTIIRQGLDFFHIASKFVYRLVPVEIPIRHASVVVREVRCEVKTNVPPSKTSHSNESKTYKRMLVFLVGDAALNTHFWAGRGMNNGMQTAMALARNIVRSCVGPTTSTAPPKPLLRTSLRFLDFLDYEGFLSRLRIREEQGHFLRILIDPNDSSTESPYAYAHLNYSFDEYKKTLFRKMRNMAQYFHEQLGWPHTSRSITDEELQEASNRIGSLGVVQLYLANPWATRLLVEREVLVQDTYPFQQQQFLPVPSSSSSSSVLPQSTSVKKKNNSVSDTHRLYLVLWIGDDNNQQKLVRSLQNSPVEKHQLRLDTAKNMAEVQRWMIDHHDRFSRKDTLFKIVIGVLDESTTTVVDVIRTVRSADGVPSQVPVLLLTLNKNKNILAALEFPNILTSDMIYDLYEFVGIKMQEQWHDGWPVIDVAFKKQKNSSTAQQTTTAAAAALLSPSPPSANEASPMLVPRNAIGFNPMHDRPLLLWMDSEMNDPSAVDAIEESHPTLEMRFKPTLSAAYKYLLNLLRDLKQRKLLVISKGYYVAPENKTVIDVIHLFDNELNLPNVPICVYTGNRQRLLELTPDIPLSRVDVTDQRDELLEFIRSHLDTTWL